jgi:hypothetical protein
LEYVREEWYPIDTPNNKAFSKFIENTLWITLGGSLKKL